MLPSFLIQALFGFGAGCFIICITIFHYFRDKVDAQERENLTVLFSTSVTEEFVQDITSGEIPLAVTKDLVNQIQKIVKPRRRLRSLLFFFPVAGGLFMGSALLASVAGFESEIIMPIADVLEFLADCILLIAFIVIVYCIFQLIKLPRELT